jgi:hypothetical protein
MEVRRDGVVLHGQTGANQTGKTSGTLGVSGGEFELVGL